MPYRDPIKKAAHSAFMKRERRTPTKAEMEIELAAYSSNALEEGKSYPNSYPPTETHTQTHTPETKVIPEIIPAEVRSNAAAVDTAEKLTWTDSPPSDMPESTTETPVGPPPMPSQVSNFITEAVGMFHELACTALKCECFVFTDRLRAAWDRTVRAFGPKDLDKFQKYLPYLSIVGLAGAYLFAFKAHMDHAGPPKPPKAPPKALEAVAVSTQTGLGAPRMTATG